MHRRNCSTVHRIVRHECFAGCQAIWCGAIFFLSSHTIEDESGFHNFSDVSTYCRFCICARYKRPVLYAAQHNRECSENWIWVEAEMSIYCIRTMCKVLSLRTKCPSDNNNRITVREISLFFNLTKLLFISIASISERLPTKKYESGIQ